VVTVTGRQEGAEGHFVAEMTFPLAGDWKWMIHPEPYGETSFETLTVLSSPDSVSYPANILTGSCGALGDIAFPLGVVEPRAGTKLTQIPVAVGGSTIGSPLPKLMESGYAIGISAGEPDAAPVACGEITSVISNDAGELVLGLQDMAGGENIGVAVLRDEGDRTAVALYLLNPLAAETTPALSGETKTVEILDSFVFEPYSLEIAPGDTVTWINNSETAHTVTGDDLAFEDSGPIDPGDSFSITFHEPGTYAYRCGPHPGMIGTIVVA
jgi:plastocyanin